MSEEWRPIPRFEGEYEASNRGRLRSVKRGRIRVLKQHHMGTRVKYRASTLSFHGKYRPQLVHRMVLEAFIGSAPEGTQACHRDGNPENNAVENLYWGIPAANAADMKRHNRHRNGRKTECMRGHPFDDQNTYWRPSGKRKCRKCAAAYLAAWTAKRKAA